MSEPMNVINKLKETYKKETYISKYGGSFFLTIIKLVFFIILMSNCLKISKLIGFIVNNSYL